MGDELYSRYKTENIDKKLFVVNKKPLNIVPDESIYSMVFQFYK